jgi:Flp pilus assembly CpaF family ATPase
MAARDGTDAPCRWPARTVSLDSGLVALAELAFNDLARYGPLTALLDDRDVWEIMINSPSEVCPRQAS